jgi:hypothetical protein
MSAPWVSVMRLGNLQLGRGLWASFQITGSPFFLHPAAIRARCATCLRSVAIQRIVPWAVSARFKPRRLSRRFPALVAAFDSGSLFVLSIVFGPNLDELGIRGKQRPL